MANKILPVADALKQLYQSLGGDDPEVLDMSTNTELIQEIAKVAEGGGGGLPEVTAADDGRVLGVDDGEWKAVKQISVNVPIYLLYSEGSSPEYCEATGDFEEAFQLASENKPIFIAYVRLGVIGDVVGTDLLSYKVDIANNRIWTYLDSTTGYLWTAEGVTFWVD